MCMCVWVCAHTHICVLTAEKVLLVGIGKPLRCTIAADSLKRLSKQHCLQNQCEAVWQLFTLHNYTGNWAGQDGEPEVISVGKSMSFHLKGIGRFNRVKCEGKV